MKISLAVLFGAVIVKAATSSSSSSSSTDASLRGAARQTQTQTVHTECTLFLKETRYMSSASTDGPVELQVLTKKKWSCEFDPVQAINVGVTVDTVELKGIENTFLESQGAKSGLSTLLTSKGIVETSDGRIVMVIPPSAVVQVLERPDADLDNSIRRRRQRRNLAASSGTLKTLVIRVIAKNGIEPTASIKQLRSDVFEDQVCLKSQYEACSHGRLKIEPFQGNTKTGRTINGGVVDVKIDINPVNENKDIFEKKAKEKAKEMYGDLATQFDLVMFCMPRGTGDWLAYAYVNRNDSYFNDKWCSSVSTQVHEVGHNLGLAHSGEGPETYGDQSGMMGFSYNMDDAPNMCFNPAKNYQLGWYIEQQEFVNPLTDILAKNNENSRDYILNGVNDFQFGRNGSQYKLISLQLKQQNSRDDYYVGFNRRAGMNSGTVENANQVTIVKKTGGVNEYGQSWKVSNLSAIGDTYTIENFDESSFDVTVKLISINGKDAKIKISTSNSVSCNKVKDSNKLTFKNNSKKNCQWVSKRKKRRCSKTWDDRLLSEWCPRICGSCQARAAAKAADSDNDTDNDTSCVDVRNLSFQNIPTKNCDWVGQEEEKKNKRCAKEWLGTTISELCPHTCGSC